MGKLAEKKKQKRDALLEAAFSLFISKGINDTSISEIVTKAKMAKGTFYLYFKDKFDIRDKLIVYKATQLLSRAAEAALKLSGDKLPELEDKVIFLSDFIIDQMERDKTLLRFISKNLSWGVFHNVLLTEMEEADGRSFYDGYCELIRMSGRRFRHPDVMLYMIVELINSTCHNVILEHDPVPPDVLKPELYGVIRGIIRQMEITE